MLDFFCENIFLTLFLIAISPLLLIIGVMFILTLPCAISDIIYKIKNPGVSKAQRDAERRGIIVTKQNNYEELERERKERENMYIHTGCPNCKYTDNDNIIYNPIDHKFTGRYRCGRCGCEWELKDKKKL